MEKEIRRIYARTGGARDWFASFRPAMRTEREFREMVGEFYDGND